MPDGVRRKTCARCGSGFHCGPGLAQDGVGCWCDDMPALHPKTDEDCLCRACLADAVETEALQEARR